MQIINNERKECSEASAIMAYFGRHPGQKLTEFMDEIKQLSPESKTELAIGAAKELGWTVNA